LKRKIGRDGLAKPPRIGAIGSGAPSRKSHADAGGIKACACQIWERHGGPENREEEFWQHTEQELRNEDKSSPTRTLDNLQLGEQHEYRDQDSKAYRSNCEKELAH
jgi:hypothetical protein